MSAERFRLRLRLPGGAELEAEGSPEFVQAERRAFLEESRPRTPAAQAAAEPYAPPPFEQLTETRAGAIQLRAKPHGRDERDACLVLLAAAHKLLNVAKPTAAQLARWLRSSGYPVGRVDRVLAQSLEKGEILASGTRRARRYELTGPGRAKAFIIAAELARTIEGPARRQQGQG